MNSSAPGGGFIRLPGRTGPLHAGEIPAAVPGYQPAEKAPLAHGEDRVIGLLVHPGPQSPGNQVLAALQHAAGEPVPAAEQAQLPGDGAGLLLEQQLPSPGPQLALQYDGVTDFFHSITSCYGSIINRQAFLPKGQFCKNRLILDIIETIVKILPLCVD